ncbi:MAG: VIT domain-containing protein, partial [Planctomycetota bacterium]
ITVRERTVLRARDNTLTRLENDPRWLVGYKSDASTEALGTLLANVDGRNVPLTIGYHKVTVDIRDGIARTMVEQSFLNHTSTVLEGVFYFPLPAGASVSSFGMWIGDELVEGDIVEKQRARAIYETILREKRDPGLLEWSGGNIFKARVYPIIGEKRIRIGYTQVLPRRGTTTSYHYALQSDMLKRAPLRRLELKVLVHSADPLAEVRSPSHIGRLRRTPHAASFEWSDEEVTPDRDFELRITTDASAPPVRFLPHKRGADGYFMLAFDAPAAAGDGDPTQTAPPLELLILADTSGSMTGAARGSQLRFLEALLSSLGAKDRFNVATCDVHTTWLGAELLDNTPANRARALEAVESRVPLGWTALEEAVQSAASRAGARTHVVYVGDGMVTTGEADGAAVAARLPALHAGRGTFHAVVPGSKADAIVLGAVTRCGGGSLHHIGGGTDPARTAFDLLRDITTPAVKDLQVRFDGVAVASVHPSRFPNLPAGGRQLVVGRYDPSAGPLKGTVHVTGTFQGKPIARTAAVEPPPADLGNSFIPRLWARRRLDHLLAQGRAKEIQSQVVSLSERFQIITPYTSFLVLESEADRERFKVQRQFRIRDGEEFFQKGRDNAKFALAQQQMQAARAWRQRLRMQLMDGLLDMHRPLTWQLGQPLINPALAEQSAIGVGGGAGGRFGARFGGKRGRANARRSLRTEEKHDSGGEEADHNETDNNEEFAEEEEQLDKEADEDFAPADALKRQANEPAADPAGPAAPTSPSPRPARESAGKAMDGRFRKDMKRAQRQLRQLGGFASRAASDNDELGALQILKTLRRPGGDYLDGLFPRIGAGRAPRAEPQWKAELAALAKRLDHRAVVAGADGAFRIRTRAVWTDRRGRAAAPASAQWLLGKDGWVVVDNHAPGYDFAVRWVHDGVRGVVNANWKLGRTRPAAEDDAAAWPNPVAWLFGDALAGWAAWNARLTKLDDGLVELEFTLDTRPGFRQLFHVDPERGVMVRVWSESNAAKSAVTEWSGFHQVGGVWWPAKATRVNPARQGGGSHVTEYRVEQLAPAAANAARTELLGIRDGAILLGPAPLDLEKAKQAVKDGSPSLEEQWMVLRVDAILKRLGDRLGTDVLRVALLRQRRRNEELKQLLMTMGAALAAQARPADFGASQWLLGWGGSLNAGNERAALLQALQPVFQRYPEDRAVAFAWDAARRQVLEVLNRPDAV